MAVEAVRASGCHILSHRLRDTCGVAPMACNDWGRERTLVAQAVGLLRARGGSSEYLPLRGCWEPPIGRHFEDTRRNRQDGLGVCDWPNLFANLVWDVLITR